MAKDYFQDITPPHEHEPRSARVPAQDPVPEETSPERSIRNIQVSNMRQRARVAGTEARGERSRSGRNTRRSRMWLWVGISFAVLILIVLGLVALRPTTVSVIPRSHTVLFDETARFTAYPEASAAEGTLPFMLETSTFEDSQVVVAEGKERVEEKASGAVTVYNSYSAQPVKLVKDTRFQTPEGLIFRAPADIAVPGKSGTKPGEITITIFADAAGERYNIGPVSRFTLPGLKSSPDMYNGVYARSTGPMSGGFVGERAAIAPGVEESARSEIRSRLTEKARVAARTRTNETAYAFPDLARIIFESLPDTTEAGGKVRINERIRMELPAFPADIFAAVVAQSVNERVEPGTVALEAGETLAAHPETPPGDAFATSPLPFTLSGSAQLVWNVNEEELAAALVGRDQSAFQTVVAGFPGIEEAHARIQPFWKNAFPAQASDIRIKIEEPRTAP